MYRERTYTDEEGRTVTTRVRKQQHSVQFRSETRIVDGKPVQTATRAYLKYQGPEGGYKLKIEDGNEQLIESESEDDGADDGELSARPSNRLTGRSKVVGGASVLSEMGDDAATAVLDLDAEAKPPKHASRLEKAWLAVKELVDTEENMLESGRVEERYVGKLSLLDKEFRERVEGESGQCGLNKDRHARLFSNISSIYQFHYSHFLPPLLERRRDWQVQQTISDVIVRLAPFLKMYSEYTNNYSRAAKTFEETKRKSRAFARIVEEVEECYREVMTIAEALGRQIRGLVTPSRLKLKEGDLVKLSARTGNREPRHIFLFNDLLLMASNRLITTGSKFKLRAVINVDSMELREGDRLDAPYSWYIRDGPRQLELAAGGEAEKADWLRELWRAQKDTASRLSTFHSPSSPPSTPRKDPQTPDTERRAEQCATCKVIFRGLLGSFRRPKACSVCARVECSRCRSLSAWVPAAGSKRARMCRDCAGAGSNVPPSSGPPPPTPDPGRKEGGEEEDENGPEDHLLAGWLEIASKWEKDWLRRYFVLNKQFVLAMYAAENSPKLSALPLTGCTVSMTDSPQTFRLLHLNREYLLRAQTQDSMAEQHESAAASGEAAQQPQKEQLHSHAVFMDMAMVTKGGWR